MKPLILVWSILAVCGSINAQTTGTVANAREGISNQQEGTSRPAVVSAQMRDGKIVYKLNGRIVENSVRNSLMTNLGKVLVTQGKETPVFIVVDVRAPFAQFEHIETACDKVDLPNRRFFVSNFTSGVMTEIHWADKAIPIP